MAANDRRDSVASSEASLVDPAVVAKILPKKDAVAGKIKLKNPNVKPKLNKQIESNDTLPDSAPRSPSPDSPLINEIDAELRKSFPTGRPMEDKSDLIQCKHCKKSMLTSVAASHIKMCLQKKQDRAQKKKENKEAARKLREAQAKGEDKDGDANMEDSVTVGKREPVDGDTGNDSMNGGSQPPSKNAKKSAVKATTDDNGNKKASSSKKRKAGDSAEGGADSEPKKKKTKKELEAAKPKAPKPKGPVDVEKQCGVLLANGAQCARSLTCKSHSMGAKRAVPGRSLPYDMLLAAYQKKNQAKQQKAAIDANAPLPDEIDMTTGPIDSDEEKDLVMAAIARSRPRPLEQHVFVPVRRKYAYVRIREMLGQALGGGNRAALAGAGTLVGGLGGIGGGLFSAQTLMGGALVGGTDAIGGGAGGEGDGRRDSVGTTRPGTSAGAGGGGVGSRKASVVGVGA